MPQDDQHLSLFDRENLEYLDALRYRPSNAPLTPPTGPAQPGSPPVAAQPGNADRIFATYRIRETDETWGMGELNVKIIHRGRIRIHRQEWPQVISTCSAGFTEDGIRKDFYLNVLQHPQFVRLVYISYRYKRPGDKQHEHRRGILVDDVTDIRTMMTHLAFWFTAQPHAETNYAIFEQLVDDAMTKLAAISHLT
jgi:hypothetical protein